MIESAYKRFNDDSSFRPRESATEANMIAIPKSKVFLGVGAIQLKSVWVGEFLWVSICCR